MNSISREVQEKISNETSKILTMKFKAHLYVCNDRPTDRSGQQLKTRFRKEKEATKIRFKICNHFDSDRKVFRNLKQRSPFPGILTVPTDDFSLHMHVSHWRYANCAPWCTVVWIRYSRAMWCCKSVLSRCVHIFRCSVLRIYYPNIKA